MLKASFRRFPHERLKTVPRSVIHAEQNLSQLSVTHIITDQQRGLGVVMASCAASKSIIEDHRFSSHSSSVSSLIDLSRLRIDDDTEEDCKINVSKSKYATKRSCRIFSSDDDLDDLCYDKDEEYIDKQTNINSKFSCLDYNEEDQKNDVPAKCSEIIDLYDDDSDLGGEEEVQINAHPKFSEIIVLSDNDDDSEHVREDFDGDRHDRPKCFIGYTDRKMLGTDRQPVDQYSISSDEEVEGLSSDEAEWVERDVCSSDSDNTSSSYAVLIVSDDEVTEEERDESNVRTVNKKQQSVFSRRRDLLTRHYFDLFNNSVFQDSLSQVLCDWSKTLRTTAGFCKCGSRQGTRFAEIQLSIKVVDSEEKLKNTLMHEMCHAAAWLIDGITKPPHGKCFKKWASLAIRNCRGIKVTTKHDYAIAYKYAWGCTNTYCDVIIQRHSRSFKFDQYRCSKCKSRFVEIEVPDKSSRCASDHVVKKKREATGFSLFLKNHSAQVRAKLQQQNGYVTQPEVMKECSRLWAAQKDLN